MEEGDGFKSAEFLGYLIKGMAEGVIFIDENNITRLCNPVGGKIRGVTGQELLNKNFLDCHPKKTHKKVLDLIADLREGRIKEESRTVRLKGRFFEHSYSAVHDSSERFLGIVAVSRDITDRILLEKDLKENARQLEHSNHLKDLFSDIMSHDFINPVSIIQNYSEMILEQDLSCQVAEDVKTIHRSSDRLIEMIENAKTYSKLEGENEVIFIEKDLASLIDNTLEEFSSHALEKNIQLHFQPKESFPADVSPFMGEVFWNIISNAIKYSPPKSTIKIEIEFKDPYYIVSVIDKADLIPEEFRKTIFERFTRVGKESVKGTGLGLAIVKRIVELHKGEAWVEPDPDGGNIFKVKLPKNQLEKNKV